MYGSTSFNSFKSVDSGVVTIVTVIYRGHLSVSAKEKYQMLNSGYTSNNVGMLNLKWNKEYIVYTNILSDST